jgi:hypothetical protein
MITLLSIVSTMIKPIIYQNSVMLTLQEALGMVKNSKVMTIPMMKSDKDSRAEEVVAKMQQTSRLNMN